MKKDGAALFNIIDTIKKYPHS
jgi:hypothetical protein